MNTTVSDLITSMRVGYDTTFEINEFNEPRIRSEVETVKSVILFILFTKPGQYPSIPTLGLDIENLLYSYYDEIDEDDLVNQICNQCSALDVYFEEGMVAVKKVMYKDQPSLLIHIEGTESYPEGYMKDSVDIADRYLIGITFDEMNQMVYNISSQKGGQ